MSKQTKIDAIDKGHFIYVGYYEESPGEAYLGSTARFGEVICVPRDELLEALGAYDKILLALKTKREDGWNAGREHLATNIRSIIAKGN